MRPWQRNRLVLAAVIILSVVLLNLPMLSLQQSLSLIIFLVVIFAAYVLFWNSYKSK